MFNGLFRQKFKVSLIYQVLLGVLLSTAIYSDTNAAPPTVTLDEPVDGYVTRETTLEVAGTVDDPAATVDIKVVGTTEAWFAAVVDGQNLTYTATVTLFANESNALTAKAENQAQEWSESNTITVLHCTSSA